MPVITLGPVIKIVNLLPLLDNFSGLKRSCNTSTSHVRQSFFGNLSIKVKGYVGEHETVSEAKATLRFLCSPKFAVVLLLG